MLSIVIEEKKAWHIEKMISKYQILTVRSMISANSTQEEFSAKIRPPDYLCM